MSEICHHWKCQKTVHLILIWICKLNQIILNGLSVLVKILNWRYCNKKPTFSAWWYSNNRLHQHQYCDCYPLYSGAKNNHSIKVLTEVAMYGHVNIKALTSHLSNITQHERDGKMVTIRIWVVHDETGFANVSIFEELTNKVVNEKSYRFTNLNVGRFKQERVLKTTDVSKTVEIKDLQVEVENYGTRLN